MLDCGRGLNHSSTVVEFGIIPSGTVGVERTYVFLRRYGKTKCSNHYVRIR